MAFDRTNTSDLIALRDEETLDPVNMGYAAVQGITHKTMDLFNNPDSNVLDTANQYIGEEFTSEVALDVIDPDEVTIGSKFSGGQARWLDYLFSASAALGTKFADFETKFRALFAAYNPTSVTLDALDARNRKISRAEFLFGTHTVISKDDWVTARDYVGA